jgi:hypothetical protein
VILGQESNGFFVTALSHKPTRRFGDKPDRANDNDTGEALANEGNSPLEVAADKVATVGDSSGGNGTTKPTTVVKTWKFVKGCPENNIVNLMNRVRRLTDGTTAPMRRSDFNGISRGRDDHNLDSQTKNEPADNKLWKCHTASDDDRSNDNNTGTNEHALATAELVGNDGTERSCDDRTTAR